MGEDDVYLKGQSGTLRLDWFTHTLVVKCTSAVSQLGARILPNVQVGYG